jgi:GNAT superfamily N-acetyltransferase
MLLKSKNNNYEYNISIKHFENGRNRDYYSLTIPTQSPNTNAGFLNFSFTKYGNSLCAWIYDICVPEKYRGTGNGSALLDALEYVCYRHRVRSIAGKFYPHDTNLSRDEMIAFYEKRGYGVELYDKEIYKYLFYDKIKEDLEPRISDYQIEELIEDELEK